MRTTLLTLLVAAALAAAALLAVGGTLDGSPRWTPDGLFYQARSLELQGATRDGGAARRPSAARWARSCAAIDPTRSGDPAGSRYNAQFYERRVAVPAAAAALEPIAGERALLDLSLVGYVAAILAHLRPAAAALPAADRRRRDARHRLPAGARRPLELPAHRQLGAGARDRARSPRGLLVLDRGPRWLIPWTLSILRPLVHARQHLDPARSRPHG